MDIATKTSNILNQQMTEEKELTRPIEKNELATRKLAKEAARRSKTCLTTIQRIQLQRSQTSTIVRNVRSDVAGQETYTETERAFNKVLRMLSLTDVKVNYIRRLPGPKGDTSREPLAMKVELSCIGDKIKNFKALEELIRNKVVMPYQINNDIPQYAMNQYKFLSRVVAEVCKAHPKLKTKVVINRGDTEPSIAIKHGDENIYRRIPDKLVEPAKEEVNRRTKM